MTAGEKRFFLILGTIIAAIVLFAIGTPGNLNYVKANGAEKWRQIGFEPIAYQGYQWGRLGYGDYGGAKVWWELRKIPDNGVTYSGYLVRWGDELHVYGPIARDALRPR